MTLAASDQQEQHLVCIKESTIKAVQVTILHTAAAADELRAQYTKTVIRQLQAGRQHNALQLQSGLLLSQLLLQQPLL